MVIQDRDGLCSKSSDIHCKTDGRNHECKTSEENGLFSQDLFHGNFNEEGGKASETLQDAFLKFKKSRQKKLKQNKSLGAAVKGEQGEEKMKELRLKIVEQAKSYLGVPYARRYHEPGSAEYDMPLFLDCCGLVRKVLRDMKRDFGFNIGPWNQAYMFDTLPIDIQDVKDMKPGDLVFVSGIFYNPKMRRQRHHIVHVEIWAGDGEKTIGARWKKGRLQIHDSYQYVSKSYHSMVYHFKSIDTWLKGICKSYCSEHAWKSSTLKPGRRSIFAINETESDEAADDCSEDENVPRNQKKLHEMKVETYRQNAKRLSHESGNDTTEYSESCKRSESCQDTLITDCFCAPEAHRVTAFEDNQESNNGMIFPVDFSDQCYSTDDVVSHPNGGKTGREGTGGQVPLRTTNVGRLKGTTSRKAPNDDDEQSNDRRPTRQLCRPNPSYTRLHQKSPTFFIGGNNGAKMVEATLTSLGWKRIHDNNDRTFYLKWVECKKNVDFSSFREGEQLVNHIPNGNVLTTKIGLLTSLQEFERVSSKFQSSASSKTIQIKDFFPETYKLQSQGERDNFIHNIYQDGEVWICKPTGMNQGKGIFLIRNQDELQERFLAKQKSEVRQKYVASPGRVVQRYIPNPLLLNGFKFDIRTYMLIAGTCPYMVFYHPGYVRLSLVPYSLNQEEMHAHLTNQYIQKKHPLYKEVKEETVWSLERLQKYINETYNKENTLPEDWVFTAFTRRMQEIMLWCFNSVRHKLERKLGYFDLLGFDFMLDENLKVWLIEINVNPALHTNCKILLDVIPELVDGTLKLVLEVFEKSKKQERLSPLENLGKFQLLYSGEKK